MLNEALLKLEQDIDQMMAHNKDLTAKVERITQERDQLSQKIQLLENDNETLLLDGIDQEEKQEQTLNRIKGMLNRFNNSEADTAVIDNNVTMTGEVPDETTLASSQ
jgi:chromosome segregation ATPase